jgi:hypothetical protein
MSLTESIGLGLKLGLYSSSTLQVCTKSARILVLIGGIAQLGERLHGMQEVSGSIPLISTIAAPLLYRRCTVGLLVEVADHCFSSLPCPVRLEA